MVEFLRGMEVGLSGGIQCGYVFDNVASVHSAVSFVDSNITILN